MFSCWRDLCSFRLSFLARVAVPWTLYLDFVTCKIRLHHVPSCFLLKLILKVAGRYFFQFFFTTNISADIGVKFYGILCMVINFHFIRVKGRNYLYRLYRVFRKEVKKVILHI